MWMEYEEFVEAVKKRMEEEMGEEGSVSINSMEKNNQTHWDGLEIKDKESRMGAAFRLRGLYAAYRKSGMEHTVSYILEMLEKKPDLASWDIPGEWEAVKGRIRLALLNETGNCWKGIPAGNSWIWRRHTAWNWKVRTTVQQPL